jgi:hypothetical protein
MRYDRISIRWSLVIFLGAALNAFAVIRPNSPGGNPPPVDRSQATEAAPAPEQASAISTAVVPSMPLPVAPAPLNTQPAQPAAGLSWASFVIVIVGLFLCIVALLKLYSRSKQRDATK